MQRPRRNASRKADLVATLSPRALIIFVPEAGSFDHDGTRPQRRIATSRLPPLSVRITGAPRADAPPGVRTQARGPGRARHLLRVPVDLVRRIRELAAHARRDHRALSPDP